jgi:hypothetical protein
MDASKEKDAKPDPLVEWAWNPGPGRESAPGTFEDFVQLMKWWRDQNAACPSTN